jgi:hypothetical protein
MGERRMRAGLLDQHNWENLKHKNLGCLTSDMCDRLAVDATTTLVVAHKIEKSRVDHYTCIMLEITLNHTTNTVHATIRHHAILMQHATIPQCKKNRHQWVAYSFIPIKKINTERTILSIGFSCGMDWGARKKTI